MDPNTAITGQWNNSLINYYLDCNGNNPIQLSNLSATVNLLNSTLYSLYSNTTDSHCYHQSSIYESYKNISTLHTILLDIDMNTNCNTTGIWYYDIVNRGVCEELYNGMSILFLGMFAYAVFLFFLNFTSGILYQYTNTVLWNMGSKYSTLRLYEVIPGEDDEGVKKLDISIQTDVVEEMKLNADVECDWTPRSKQAVLLSQQVDLNMLYNTHHQHIHDGNETNSYYLETCDVDTYARETELNNDNDKLVLKNSYKPVTVIAPKNESHSVFGFMYWNYGKIYPTVNISAVTDANHFETAHGEYWNCEICKFNNHNTDICYGCNNNYEECTQNHTNSNILKKTLQNEEELVEEIGMNNNNSSNYNEIETSVHKDTVIQDEVIARVECDNDIALGMNQYDATVNQMEYNEREVNGQYDATVNQMAYNEQEANGQYDIPVEGGNNVNECIDEGVDDNPIRASAMNPDVAVDVQVLDWEEYIPVQELNEDNGTDQGSMMVETVPLTDPIVDVVPPSALDDLHAELADMLNASVLQKQQEEAMQLQIKQLQQFQEPDIPKVQPVEDAGWYCSGCFHFNKSVASVHCSECGALRVLETNTKKKKKTVKAENNEVKSETIPISIVQTSNTAIVVSNEGTVSSAVVPTKEDVAGNVESNPALNNPMSAANVLSELLIKQDVRLKPNVANVKAKNVPVDNKSKLLSSTSESADRDNDPVPSIAEGPIALIDIKHASQIECDDEIHKMDSFEVGVCEPDDDGIVFE